MGNLENLKHAAEELNHDAAEATRQLMEKEARIKKDDEEIATLKTKIPQDERTLNEERATLRKDEAEKSRLIPEIANIKRKQVQIHNQVTKTAMELNKNLRDLKVKDHGKDIKELKEQKQHFGLN